MKCLSHHNFLRLLELNLQMKQLKGAVIFYLVSLFYVSPVNFF